MQSTNTMNRPTVVSVGVAAEEVKEFDLLFERLSPNIRLAYLVMLYLQTTHEIKMTELLQERSQMPVPQLHQCIRVEPKSRWTE